MTEDQHGRTDAPAGGVDGDGSALSATSGDAGVDAVLSTLDRLQQLSVEEHLPLFEQAHDALRRTLERPAEATGSGS